MCRNGPSWKPSRSYRYGRADIGSRGPGANSPARRTPTNGSAHPIMRMFFERAHKELESRLPQQIGSRFGSLVVTRQPGT